MAGRLKAGFSADRAGLGAEWAQVHREGCPEVMGHAALGGSRGPPRSGGTLG